MRALRVYERRGLIKPARSAKGWRLYGPEELIRLNSIVALKDFGLTLAQIRKAFGASPPALAQILDMQLKVWAARQLAARPRHRRAFMRRSGACRPTRRCPSTNSANY